MSVRQHELVVGTTADLAAARSFAAASAQGVVDSARVDDVVLAASELVTNALEHGSGPARFGVTTDGATLRLVVESATENEVQVPSPAPPEAARGRGLLIVSALADSVHVEPVDGGVAVSCEFRRGPAVTAD